MANGHNLAVFEAIKMHSEIVAEINGTVDQVTAMAGIPVAADDVLIEITD